MSWSVSYSPQVRAGTHCVLTLIEQIDHLFGLGNKKRSLGAPKIVHCGQHYSHIKFKKATLEGGLKFCDVT